jgi:N-acetylmuramoyl-L-alanine amidase
VSGDLAVTHRPWCIALMLAVAWSGGASAALGAQPAHPAKVARGLSPQHPAAAVRALSLTTSFHGAALTVQISRETGYTLFTLDHPYRVVVDLKTTERARSARVPRAAGMVTAVRAGVRPHGALRLVLQLESASPARARWMLSDSGAAPRLVISVGTEPGLAAMPPKRDVTVANQPRLAPPLPKRDVVVATQPGLAPPAPKRGAASPPVAASTPSSPQATISPREPPVRAAHAPLDSGRDVVIALDPGHGGKDSGAIGHSGTEEKNVVLGIALALANRIDAEPGMRAVLTRDHDEFLKLQDRWSRARSAKADLFVSIHADSIRDRHVSGSSVYVLSERGATNEAARWLADRENAAALMGGVSLADKDSRLRSVLLDLSQSATISASMMAAERVLTALGQVGEVRKPEVQQAGFVVLKAPDMPSMLIETAYISNSSDERRLRTPSEQRKLADAIFAGLLAYFQNHPPAGTRLARALGSGASSAVLAGSALAPSVPVTR